MTWEDAKRAFDYFPETGELIWKIGCFKGRPALAYIHKKSGYRHGSWMGYELQQHRLIMFWMTGKWPEEVDHDNRVRHDNRWVNLEESTRSKNMKNKSIYKKNKSGHPGVYYRERDKKWVAVIRVNGNLKHLMQSTDMQLAIEARKTAEIQHGFKQGQGQGKGSWL